MSRRVLLITSVLPWPLHRNGGAQRTALLRRALCESGCDVDVLGVIPQPSPPPPHDAELRRHGVVAHLPVELESTHPRRSLPGPLGMPGRVRRQWLHRYAPAPAVVAWLGDHAGSYDAIYVRYVQTALLAALDRRDPAASPRVVVDLDDVDWLTLESRFAAQPWPGLGGRIGMAVAFRTVKARCLRALPAFNSLFVASDEDAVVLRRHGLTPAVLPNIPFADETDPNRLAPLFPPADSSRTVLFVGDLQFGPNATGLDRFLNHIWPAVRARAQDATLRIVGRGLSEEQRSHWADRPGVAVIGFAESLRGEYAACACTIAPVWWGGGTKVKVVESAALGRPVVATAHAARGYGALAGKTESPVVVAHDDADFAAALSMLLINPGERTARSLAGPVLVREGFGFDRFRRVAARSLSD